MEIFVLREGQQTGPFNEDTLQSLCHRGGLAPSDMAWHQGLPTWMPLAEVLKPGSERPTAPPPVPHANGTRSSSKKAATAKQKALLKYIGATYEEGITKEDAALAISDAIENPKFTARLQKWGEEKLRLHPDVFQDEIDHRRAHRVSRYLERCQTEGAEAVKDVTKAHVQVLVESLDKRVQVWERDPREALWDYLLPAIAEHFPQLVQEGWKGRLKPGLSKVAAAMAAGELPKDAPSPGAFSAALRGMVYGGAVLALILGGNYLFNKPNEPAVNQPAPSKSPATPAVTESAKVSEKPAPLVHPTEAPLIGANPIEAPAPVPGSAPIINAEAKAAPAVEPAPNTPPAAPSGDPAMASAAPATSAPANPAVALNTPPAPAPTAVPAPTPAPTEPTEPATPAPTAGFKSILTITKPVAVQLQFGTVTLTLGTRVRFIAMEGGNVRVNYNNNVILVPAIATDVDPSALPPAPTAALPPPPIAPAVPVLPKPAAPKPASPLSDL
jgi:hypothetical protein